LKRYLAIFIPRSFLGRACGLAALTGALLSNLIIHVVFYPKGTYHWIDPNYGFVVDNDSDINVYARGWPYAWEATRSIRTA